MVPAALCSKTLRRRRKKRREIKLILWKVLINVFCEEQNYVNNLILHSARFHSTVVVFWQKVSSNMATFRKQASQSKLSFEKVFRWNTVEPLRSWDFQENRFFSACGGEFIIFQFCTRFYIFQFENQQTHDRTIFLEPFLKENSPRGANCVTSHL